MTVGNATSQISQCSAVDELTLKALCNCQLTSRDRKQLSQSDGLNPVRETANY
jgi:hypothetical protein